MGLFKCGGKVAVAPTLKSRRADWWAWWRAAPRALNSRSVGRSLLLATDLAQSQKYHPTRSSSRSCSRRSAPLLAKRSCRNSSCGSSCKSWITDPLTYSSGEGRLMHRDYGDRLLREPALDGRVHFAGTETEAQNGHVEGAVRAGQRAARVVVEGLRS